MAGQDRFTKREKTVLDDTKFKMFGDPVSGSKSKPTLAIYYTGSNPRVCVYTNVPDDKDNGMIAGGLDLWTFKELVQRLEELCLETTEPGTTHYIDCKKPGRDGSLDNMFVEATIFVGKDKEGKIWIQVVSYDKSRPKIRFYFGAGLFHVSGRVVNGDKVEESIATTSRRRALSWVSNLTDIMPIVAAIYYTHKEKEAKGGGGGGYNKGGGGNRGGGGGNREREETPAAVGDAYDDDMPY